MGQITIYLDDETEQQLAGAWPDLPSAEEIREDQGQDLPREAL